MKEIWSHLSHQLVAALLVSRFGLEGCVGRIVFQLGNLTVKVTTPTTPGVVSSHNWLSWHNPKGCVWLKIT